MAEVNIFSTPEAERFADRIKTDMKKDIELVQSQLKSDIELVKTQLTSNISDVKNQLTNDINNVKHDIELVKNDVKHLQSDVTEIKNDFKVLVQRQNSLEVKIETVRTDLAHNNTVMTRYVLGLFVTMLSLAATMVGFGLKIISLLPH